MRKFIKAFSIYVTCILFVVCCFFTGVSASATFSWTDTISFISPSYMPADSESGELVSNLPYNGTLYYVVSYGPFAPVLDPSISVSLAEGTYVVSGHSVPSYITDGSNAALSGVLVTSFDFETEFFSVVLYDFGEPFVVDEYTFGIAVQSYDVFPVLSPEPLTLFSSAWDLLKSHIYGDMEMTPEMNLTLTLLATLIAVAVVVLPFIIIWLIIRFVTSFMR